MFNVNTTIENSSNHFKKLIIESSRFGSDSITIGIRFKTVVSRYVNESESYKQELDNLSQSNTAFKQNIEKA